MNKGSTEPYGRSMGIESPTPGGAAKPAYGFHPRPDHPPISSGQLAQIANDIDDIYAEMAPRPEDIEDY